MTMRDRQRDMPTFAREGFDVERVYDTAELLQKASRTLRADSEKLRQGSQLLRSQMSRTQSV